MKKRRWWGGKSNTTKFPYLGKVSGQIKLFVWDIPDIMWTLLCQAPGQPAQQKTQLVLQVMRLQWGPSHDGKVWESQWTETSCPRALFGRKRVQKGWSLWCTHTKKLHGRERCCLNQGECFLLPGRWWAWKNAQEHGKHFRDGFSSRSQFSREEKWILPIAAAFPRRLGAAQTMPRGEKEHQTARNCCKWTEVIKQSSTMTWHSRQHKTSVIYTPRGRTGLVTGKAISRSMQREVEARFILQPYCHSPSSLIYCCWQGGPDGEGMCWQWLVSWGA